MRNFDPSLYFITVFVPGRAGIDRRSNDAAAS